MKKTIVFATILLLCTEVFSQANKPTVGNFGIKAGVSIPNIGLGLTFSRHLKKNLECGASAGFSFATSKNLQVTDVSVNTTTGWINANQESTSKYLSYTITVAPFLVYHFPTNNNLDVYAGGRVSFSIGRQVNYTYTYRTYATNYESKTTGKARWPFSFGAGAGVLVGADYYFRKNMAIGVSGNVGFASYFQFGTRAEQSTQTNTGSLNPTDVTIHNEQEYAVKNIYTNTGVDGSVGVNFTFFFMRQGEKSSSSR